MMRHTILSWGLALAIVLVVLLSLVTSAVAEVIVSETPPENGVSFIKVWGNLDRDNSGIVMGTGEGACLTAQASTLDDVTLNLVGYRKGSDDLWLNWLWPNWLIVKSVVDGQVPWPKSKDCSREGNPIVLGTRERGVAIIDSEILGEEFTVPLVIHEIKGISTYYLWTEGEEETPVAPEVDTSEVVPDDWSPPSPFDDGRVVIKVYVKGRVENNKLLTSDTRFKTDRRFSSCEYFGTEDPNATADKFPSQIRRNCDDYPAGWYVSNYEPDSDVSQVVFVALSVFGEPDGKHRSSAWSPGTAKLEIQINVDRGTPDQWQTVWWEARWDRENGCWDWRVAPGQ